jgi:hypothetical protein
MPIGSKVCKNPNCLWHQLGYHFYYHMDKCRLCGSKLYEVNEHE